MNKLYDAIVVGTGAGGACVIHQMVAAGMRVLAIEKGRRIELKEIYEGGVFGPHFSSRGRGDEIKFIRNKFLQQNLRKDLPAADREIRYLRYSHHNEPEPSRPKPTSDGWMSQLVGGGTVHYGGASFRMDPVDLKMGSTFGREAMIPGLESAHQADLKDWPLEWSELERWYEEAEKLIGIAGSPGSGLPALRMNKAESHVAEVLLRNKHRAKVISAPMAINSGRHGGRNTCRHSGLCQDFACRFEAKSDMRVTLLRDAEATGLLDILPLAFARRLNTAEGKVTGVECVIGEAADMREKTFVAPVVVIACEVVESIRLLLASGIGNPDVLGKYVMYHVTGGARSIAPIATTSWDNAPHTGYIRSFYNDRQGGADKFLKTGILQFSTVGGPLQLTDSNFEFAGTRRRAWGINAHTLFEDIYPRKMDFSYIGEGFPTAYNRVELTSVQEVDRYKMQGTVISYRPHPMDLAAGRYMEAQSKEILKLAGGITFDDAPEKYKPFLTKKISSDRLFHGSGGCRFGENPEESVLDPDCRVHSLENLWVADGSFMPTGSGVNPTLTIQANALRVGSVIANCHGRIGSSAHLSQFQ
jgi:choline dehydrogenase-like flavoprotein